MPPELTDHHFLTFQNNNAAAAAFVYVLLGLDLDSYLVPSANPGLEQKKRVEIHVYTKPKILVGLISKLSLTP